MRFDDDVAAASGVPARPRRIWLKRMAGLAVAPALLPAVRAADLEKPRLTLAVGGKATLYYLPLTLAERLGYGAAPGTVVGP